MSFEEHVEATKQYLEVKYDVDLSDVRVERPLFSIEYAYYEEKKSVVMPRADFYIVVFGPITPFVYQAGLVHEMTHAAIHKITAAGRDFHESLSHHEEGKYFASSHPFAYKLFRINPFTLIARPLVHMTYGYREWSEIFSWMDGNREKNVTELMFALESVGTENAEQFCSVLYEMQPRQFVEEHRMLRGLQRYIRNGNPEHLEAARNNFLEHDGDPKMADKYMALLPKNVY